MLNLSEQLRLCFVVGSGDCRHFELLETVQQAVAGGVTCIQLRDKQANAKELIEQGRALQAILPSHVLLLINDQVDVAVELGVGVHLGQSDESPFSAREKLGLQAVVGLSITAEAQINDAKNSVVDYFGVGPVFTTTSKLDASQPINQLELEQSLMQLHPKPCVLIGGIDQSNLHCLPCHVIAGVAVISAIAKSPQPRLASRQLLNSLKEKQGD